MHAWLVTRSRNALPSPHPLEFDTNTRRHIRNHINTTYVASQTFAETVASGAHPIFSLSDGIATPSTLPDTIARLERIAAERSAKLTEAHAAIAVIEDAIDRHKESGDYAALALAAQKASELQVGATRFAKDLQDTRAALLQTRAAIAQEAASAAAAAPVLNDVMPIKLTAVAVKAAQTILLPSSTFAASVKAAHPAANDEELHRLMQAEAVAWLAPFHPVPSASARDNLRELLDGLARFYVLQRRQPWTGLNWSCTCPHFFKHYTCKHMLQFAITEGTWTLPTRFAKRAPLAATARGRKARVGPALTRGVGASQHV